MAQILNQSLVNIKHCTIKMFEQFYQSTGPQLQSNAHVIDKITLPPFNHEKLMCNGQIIIVKYEIIRQRPCTLKNQIMYYVYFYVR